MKTSNAPNDRSASAAPVHQRRIGQPRRVRPPYDWNALLTLIRNAFAYMDSRIDPPSSMHRLTPDSMAQQAETGEIWVIEDKGRPIACIFLTPREHTLYIGKLAVADSRYHARPGAEPAPSGTANPHRTD